MLQPQKHRSRQDDLNRRKDSSQERKLRERARKTSSQIPT